MFRESFFTPHVIENPTKIGLNTNEIDCLGKLRHSEVGPERDAPGAGDPWRWPQNSWLCFSLVTAPVSPTGWFPHAYLKRASEYAIHFPFSSLFRCG